MHSKKSVPQWPKLFLVLVFLVVVFLSYGTVGGFVVWVVCTLYPVSPINALD